jgi:hypothetical protein
VSAGNERVSIAADLFDKLKAGSDAPLAQPRTGTKQDRSTLRVVDGSQSRDYSLSQPTRLPLQLAQLMHRKRLMIDGSSAARAAAPGRRVAKGRRESGVSRGVDTQRIGPEISRA